MIIFLRVVKKMTKKLPPLTRWGLARYDYLQAENKALVEEFGKIGLHNHCLEIQEQAEQRKRSMMEQIRKNPANQVTERDKANNQMLWVQKMNMYQARVHEIIYEDLIYA